MSKVFLFNPPHPEGKGFTREGRCTQEAGVWATQWPPVTLAATAAVLEKGSHQLTVIDCPAVRMDTVRVEALIKKVQPDFVFWNTASPTLNHDLYLAEAIKNASPRAVTGVLGTHVSALPEIALKTPHVDMVIRREPEQTIRELCDHPERKWGTISGISYRDPETGKVRHTPDRTFLSPDQIPPPAWHHLDIRPYRLPLKGKPFLIVAPIRGCPFPCSFCTAPVYYGKKLRKRPVRQVADEIENNRIRFKVQDFFIWADTFTADKQYVIDFCQEIKQRHLDISWTCNSRVDTVDRDMLSVMKAAGLWMISFGIESGDDTILKKTGKRITVEQSGTAVRIAHELGIKTSGHFIFGLPGEIEESMQKTLAFSLELPLDIAQFYAAAPFPGTDLYGQALEAGWLQPTRVFSQSHAGMELPGLSASRVDAFRRYAYRRFYLRAGVLLNLVKMFGPDAIIHSVRSMSRFFQWVRS